MSLMHLDISIGFLVVSTVAAAVVIDVRTRRIPNYLTFPLLFMAIAVRVLFQGWPGLLLALSGAVVAPGVLLMLHAGKGLGMGDLKLAAGIGAALGPITAIAGMLAAALVGGVMAVVWLLKPGGMFSGFLPLFLIGLFGQSSRSERTKPEESDESKLTLPYGVAIGAGSLLVLALRWFTGHDVWFL